MKRDALLGSGFFHHLSPALLDEVIALSSERRIARAATIFGKGDPGSSLMAVLIGRVRVGLVSADGKEITLAVLGPGEIFGEMALLDGQPRSADAVALQDTTLLVIERRAFMPFLLRNPEVLERLFAVLCDRIRRTSLRLEELSVFDLPARLARVLAKLAQDYGRTLDAAAGGGIRIDLKLSQGELGKLVASSRESVNKQIRAWREAGILDMQDGYMIVRRAAALHELGN